MNYYNEHDLKAAAWLRELINQGLIPAGDVDTRSIVDVRPADLTPYIQCHFFAGIGGWPLALQLAGVPATTPLWTGSCPCQPFSTAGKGLAQQDERHLWPVFFDLIRQCRPPIVFGEQVASAAVVGHSDKNKSVQSVRDRKTLLRILQELKRGTARNLQGLREDEGASAEKKQASDSEVRLQKMEERETRLCSCECGEAQSQEFRNPFQPYLGGYSEENRQRCLRSDGNTFRPINPSLLERPFIGPDCATSRIHPGEHSGGLVCPECHGELMGASTDSGGVERDSWVEERSLEQLIRLNREEASGTPEECWLDGISADLEAEGYACGATVLGAHSVKSPHQRQRLYWVADGGGWKRVVFSGDCDEDRNCPECGIDYADCECLGPTQDGVEYEEFNGVLYGRMADSEQQGLEGQSRNGDNWSEPRRINQDTLRPTAESGAVSRLVLPNSDGRSTGSGPTAPTRHRHPFDPASGGGDGLADTNGSGSLDGINGEKGWGPEAVTQCCSNIWSDFSLVHCRDGKTRRIPTEPAFFPLAHGVPARVVRLRGYGNAIVPQVAAAFIQAFYETQQPPHDDWI